MGFKHVLAIMTVTATKRFSKLCGSLILYVYVNNTNTRGR